jgi:phosphoglycerate dehydrogenase-like enzyme
MRSWRDCGRSTLWSPCASVRRFPGEVLERLPELRLLVTTGMRNASIDLTAASELGIVVCGTAPDCPAPRS